jgi:hypothetical protein
MIFQLSMRRVVVFAAVHFVCVGVLGMFAINGTLDRTTGHSGPSDDALGMASAVSVILAPLTQIPRLFGASSISFVVLFALTIASGLAYGLLFAWLTRARRTSGVNQEDASP